MKTRTQALILVEQFKKLHEASGFSFEVAVRAIAIQSQIFEKLNPHLWDIAIADAKEGMKLGFPEVNQ